mgnify:CR=1 FL=1
MMAKKNKKNDPQQKNKKGFDSAVLDQAHKAKAKKEKASKNAGKYKGGL